MGACEPDGFACPATSARNHGNKHKLTYRKLKIRDFRAQDAVRKLGEQVGGVPEWLKGADCKSVGYAYVGSNPTPSTNLVSAGVAQW